MVKVKPYVLLSIRYLSAQGIQWVLCKGNHPNWLTETEQEPKKRKAAFQKGWEKIRPTAEQAIQHYKEGGWLGFVPLSLGLTCIDIDVETQEATTVAWGVITSTFKRTHIGHQKTMSPHSFHLFYAVSPDADISNGYWQYGEIRTGKGYVIAYNLNAIRATRWYLKTYPKHCKPIDPIKQIDSRTKKYTPRTPKLPKIEEEPIPCLNDTPLPDFSKVKSPNDGYNQSKIDYAEKYKMSGKLSKNYNAWQSEVGLLIASGMYTPEEIFELCDNTDKTTDRGLENWDKVCEMWDSFTSPILKQPSLLFSLFQRWGVQELHTDFWDKHKEKYKQPQENIYDLFKEYGEKRNKNG